ncbi:MAG: penicillin acylase family protein [Bacteroidota bacterium]
MKHLCTITPCSSFRTFFTFSLLLFTVLPAMSGDSGSDLAKEVQIRRTSYGVPHILAPSLKGVTFGLAYCELQDYGERVIRPLIDARGDLAKIDGYQAIDRDFARQMAYQRTVATYSLLDQATRDMLEGFAEGVNYYLSVHPERFPEYKGWHFTGYDVAARNNFVITPRSGSDFVRRWKERQAIQDSLLALEEGSNAWAFAPERSRSGHAMLVRNPHLSWKAGYYEAHLTVPGKLNFYGDFRIGGLFGIIGGFNDRLGWATTNNHPDLDEVYAFEADTTAADHMLVDGASVPLERKLLQAEFRNGQAMATETREFLFSPYGAVIHRENGKIFVLKHAGDGEFRRCQQFARMMMAQNLEEWKAAMRIQAITSSNYTYADADGNIFYVWNAAAPQISHISGGDTAATDVSRSREVWSRYISFDELPQLQNPSSGYLHNENDPFHFTNLDHLLMPQKYPPHFPAPRLRQRSQHSLQLINNHESFSLEEVVEMKHSMRMLLADQVKEDLVEALTATKPKKEMRKVLEHLKNWDNRVAAESRGGVLFQEWFVIYSQKMTGKQRYDIPWSFDDPMTTPSGLSNDSVALAALTEAIDILNERHGTYDVAWGDVHRLRRGKLDLPVGGGPGSLGCFRVLAFETDEDGKRKIRGGDGWQLAVEFSTPPKAYSILAYGQSNNPDSPHHTDQAEMFANNQMKAVAFSEEDIQANLLKSYRPGEE